jgi:hypothetical protein
MSRLMFVYLSGTEKGKTRIFTQDHVTIGTSDACDLRLVPEEGGALPDGVWRMFSMRTAASTGSTRRQPFRADRQW